MKILISAASELFTDTEPHGEGLICYEIASRLAKRGHHLYVFAPQFNLATEMPNTRVLHINDGAFASSLQPWKYQLESRRAAKKLLRDQKVDIIHHMMPFYPDTHFSWLSGPPLIIGPLFLPWVLSENDLESVNARINPAKQIFQNSLKRISQRMYHQTLNRAERILVTVDTLRDDLPDHIQGKIRVLPLGVDTSQFVPLNERPEDEQAQPTILFLANLLKRKGLQYLLEAMPKIMQAAPEVRLNVVGGGASEAYFRNMAEELNISSHVRFAGPVLHSSTVTWFQKCDVYCLPSLGEPFGISILEAMSCGKPVVTTKAGGVPEFVKDGESGYLVSPRDSEALSHAIIKILTDSTSRDAMGRYNRKLCIKNYDWDVIVDRIEQVYEEALS